MRLVEPFASEIQLPTNGVQNPYKHLYNEEYEILYLEQLLQLSDQYTQISISEDDCHKIEELTREQAASNEWFNQRSGRITASKLKQGPQLGASPDALVSCSCCGNGCVEIKCPYLLKTLSLQEYAARKTTCLQLINNEVCLDKTHSYYFQVSNKK
nr:unnamed protein product [Callosobruchus chinensis]